MPQQRMNYMGITRRQIFQNLTRARSLELAALLELDGLAGLNKDALIDKLSRMRRLMPQAVLNELTRDEFNS